MSSKSKATSRQSKNSRNQAGQTSTAPATAEATDANGPQETSRFDAIVERSRETQAERDEQVWRLGHSAGRLWAIADATLSELRALIRARDPRLDWYFGMGSSAYTDAERFFFIIRPDFDGDRDAASEFWEFVTGDPEMPETDFVQGFSEGAVHSTDEVTGRI